jgi:hypothetical protein
MENSFGKKGNGDTRHQNQGAGILIGRFPPDTRNTGGSSLAVRVAPRRGEVAQRRPSGEASCFA